ncbi:MAG: hypothetical protein VB018_11565 [Lachnospiraceae bacterium]|nr:hypothetical protein [Lachnospiraceae bacterium]
MSEINKIDLFRKTDTTLVYIASKELAEKIMGDKYNYQTELYIHVKRDNGYIIVYQDNDTKKVVPLKMNDQEYILKCAESDR